MRWLRQSSIWQVGSRRPPSITSWLCFVMLTLEHMKHIADTRGWRHSVTCITMRLFLEWDIVLDCLNLGRSFTQMLHQAPKLRFQNLNQDDPPMAKFSTCDSIATGCSVGVEWGVVKKSSAISKTFLRGRMLRSKTNYRSVTPSNDGSLTEPPASPSPATGRL